MVDNPIFHKKTTTMKLGFESGKPFAFLFPTSTLENSGCAALFEEYGVHVEIVLPHPKFLHNGELVSPCSTAWFYGNWFAENCEKKIITVKYVRADDV